MDIVYIWIYCVDLPESRFVALLILFISGYNLWIYHRVDFLFIACCMHPEDDSLVGVIIRISRYGHLVLLDAEQITGNRHCVLVGVEGITGQIAGYIGQT